ncbi:d1704442-2290-4f81-b4e6-c9db1c72879a [Thermothielavioides terrestris]|uniref:D1704442-2290-4f81-b4e6-c9db1c72879a n=1 Tax=Thermothielavioides terrestris TaxID=2587410 RepID=A0A446B9E0_9PEZI|nr:d1704442-2290-4f81-b4e6-c9db1c72879a [Thermothielavioides terrestris]
MFLWYRTPVESSHTLPPSAIGPASRDDIADRRGGNENANLIKRGHRLISTADLHLEEGGLDAAAVGGRALHAALLRVVPGARPAEDVLLLAAREVLARVDGHVDRVLVRARAALEPVAAATARVHAREDQQVGAVRADCAGGAPVSVCGRAGERQYILVRLGVSGLRAYRGSASSQVRLPFHRAAAEIKGKDACLSETAYVLLRFRRSFEREDIKADPETLRAGLLCTLLCSDDENLFESLKRVQLGGDMMTLTLVVSC